MLTHGISSKELRTSPRDWGVMAYESGNENKEVTEFSRASTVVAGDQCGNYSKAKFKASPGIRAPSGLQCYVKPPCSLSVGFRKTLPCFKGNQ